MNQHSTKLWVTITIVLSVLLIGLVMLMKSGDSKPNLSEKEVYKLAGELGLDQEKFLKDIRNEEIKKKIDEQREDVVARLTAINQTIGTPSVFVNGEYLDRTQVTLENKVQELINSGVETPIKVEVFTDYYCGACYGYESFLKQAQETFGDKIELIHKHLPGEGNMAILAYGAEAAREQGKFDEMHSALFELVQGPKQEQIPVSF